MCITTEANIMLPDMRMVDPIPTFTHIVTTLRDLYPSLAYVHVIEPGIAGPFLDSETEYDPNSGTGYKPPPKLQFAGQHESNDFIRDIWSPRPIISAGYSRLDMQDVTNVAERTGDVLAMGRYFISNVSRCFLTLRRRDFSSPLWNSRTCLTRSRKGRL